MNPLSELLLFTLAALGLVLSPGPSMIYLISRSIVQGRQAGVISLTGILSGFPVHIFVAAFGLIAILLVIPFTMAGNNLLALFGLGIYKIRVFFTI